MADRQLRVVIVGDNRSLTRTLNDSSKGIQKFSIGLGSILKGALVLGAVDAGFRAIGSAVRTAAGEFSEAATVGAQTRAVIESTGGAANVAAKDVDQLAGSLSQMSGIDDELIQKGENLLLTFKNVRNEVGQGNAIFDRATRAAVNLSVAGFGSIESTSKQLGKALNDPIKGITALSRAGVTFSASQKQTIKDLVASNRVLDAQKLILKEVESQVGGSAKALGQTLPGQLNRMRESFRNTLGDLAGRVAPVLTTALGSVNDFVTDLGKARTVSAKIRVVTSGLENLGRDLFDQAERAFESVDWQAAIETARGELLNAVRGLFQLVGRVDFGQVGQQLGQALSTAVRQVASFLNSVDFQAVGQRIVSGISDFLRGVDWVAVATGTIRLLIAALKAQASLVLGIGRELGGLIVSGIREGVSRLAATAFNAIERAALNAALKVVEPFTKLPGPLGRPFKRAKEAMQGQLAEMAASARSTAADIQSSIDSIQGKDVIIGIRFDVAEGGQPTFGITPLSKPGEAAAGAAKAAGDTARAGAKAAQEAAGTTRAAATVTENAAKEGQTAAEKQRAAFDKLISNIGLQVDQAAATRGLSDDLKRNTQLQAAIRRQISVEGNTTELARQLFDAKQARAQILAAQAEATRKVREQAAAAARATQFRALGLTADGDKPTPTVDNLKKQLAQLTNRLGADVAPKIAGQLSRISKVLSGTFGKVSEEVRQAILEMFKTIRGTFDQETEQGPSARKTGFKDFISGVTGLSSLQVKQLRSAFVQGGANGTMPQQGFGAFGMAFPQVAVAGGGAPVVDVHVQVGTREIEDIVVTQTQRRAGSSAATRTGVRPGANRGLG